MKRKLSSKDRRRLLWGIMWAFYEAVCEELKLDPQSKESAKIFLYVVKKFIRETPLSNKKSVAKKISMEEVKHLMTLRHDTASLNVPLGEDGDSSEFGDILPSGSSVIDEIHDALIREKIASVLDSEELTKKGRRYIQMRYGFDCDPVGNDVIRKILGVSRGEFSTIVRRATITLRGILIREGLDKVY